MRSLRFRNLLRSPAVSSRPTGARYIPPFALALAVGVMLLVGVLFFQWSMFTVLFLYWFETLVQFSCGAIARVILKDASIGREDFSSAFPLVVIGMPIYLFFIVVLFGVKRTPPPHVFSEEIRPVLEALPEVGVGVFAISVTYALLLLGVLRSKRTLTSKHLEQWIAASAVRAGCFLHVGLLFAAILILTFGLPRLGIILLVVWKVFFDFLESCLRESSAPSSPGPM